ncbi:choice-of-anchor U domain-containing protein, partial [Verminephrobacter aporrectodeae]
LVAGSQDGKDSGQASNTDAAVDTWGGMSTVSTLWPLFGSVLFRDPKPKDPIPTADQPQDKSSPGNAPTTQTTPVASSQDGSHTIGVRSVADKLLPTTTADAPDRPHPAADQPQGSGGGGGGGGSSGSSSTSTKSSQRTAVASTTLVVSPQGESSPGSAPTTQTTLVAGGQDGQLSADHGTRITSLAQKDAPADLTRGLEMPIGLISFQAELAPGIRTETFSLYVDPALDVNGYWMPNQEGVWVNLASELYGGKMVLEGEQLRLDFRIEDGGRFDAGAQADGSITAAGAAARMPLSLLGYPPDSGYQTFWF